MEIAAVDVGPVPVEGSPVPELKQWGIRWSIGIAVTVAVLIVSALIVAAFWYAGFPAVKRDATVTAGTLFDLLKLTFAVVAGIAGVVALVVAYRRQRVAEHTNELAKFAHELAHAADLRAEVTKSLAQAADERAKIETDRNGVRLLNERFAKASEQLGSDKAAVRLAGAYAMAGLADDWDAGRQTCVDVLCAYLRMPYTPPDEVSNEAEAATNETGEQKREVLAARQEREVRHTVVRLICAHLRRTDDDPMSWTGIDLDFTGAVFDGGDFAGVRINGGQVSFAGATFSGGPRLSFDGAKFNDGDVSFARARFDGMPVSFASANFGGGRVSFASAQFNNGELSFNLATFADGLVIFDNATFGAGLVSFTEAAISGGSLSFAGATFGGARVFFSRAGFAGALVTFDEAAFDGGQVSFAGAAFSGGEVSFDEAEFGETEVSFLRARFTGGLVQLGVAKFKIPPQFSPWREGRLPAGLTLPKGFSL